jgi:ribonuclease R
LHSPLRSATLRRNQKESTLTRKKTTRPGPPAARNKRGPGKRAGLPKFMPEKLPPLPGGKGAKPRPAQDPYAEREASRYERPIASREAIVALLETHGELMKIESVARELGLSTPQDMDALSRRLAAMLRDGQLIQNRRGGYGVASKLDLIPGGVIANAEGYGFLRPDEGGDDLYLSPAEMRKVLHGDRVLASVIGADRRGRRQGAIVEVLERRSPRLVGRVVEENGLVLVTPDDRRLHQDVLITPGKDRGARSGQIVVVEITDPPCCVRLPTWSRKCRRPRSRTASTCASCPWSRSTATTHATSTTPCTPSRTTAASA